MEEKFLQSILKTLSIISHNLEPIPFWQNWNLWSVFVLFLTLIFLIKYTRATEKMVKNQMLPNVDVLMWYDKEIKRTYFWFLNESNIPAMVNMSLMINKSVQNIGPFRIHPYHPNFPQFIRKTATTFDFLNGNESQSIEATLRITVRPAIDRRSIEIGFLKNYKFNTQTKEWNESTWGYPDPPFPTGANTN